MVKFNIKTKDKTLNYPDIEKRLNSTKYKQLPNAIKPTKYSEFYNKFCLPILCKGGGFNCCFIVNHLHTNKCTPF